MGVRTAYSLACDICKIETRAQWENLDEMWDRAELGGWHVRRAMHAGVCPDCYNPEVVYHFQYTNTFCVLCQSGEHLAIIVR